MHPYDDRRAEWKTTANASVDPATRLVQRKFREKITISQSDHATRTYNPITISTRYYLSLKLIRS
ncbi:hypothetical protein RMSM_04528 [Rhodopirellula maiorica SM1]|uniref:Uncharacterized protein n=1 Tax=Rhodopirellula maiorica SM1 TaxID=1265738 RepID=M5RX70_9BACT|nr:hypothetical protein RMSM_04528 [Rhodopirellula maiorica SM1]